MVVKGIDIIHQEMLKILSLIDEICEKEKLQYFIDGGSCIGAIRHKGFIPWDDDIDIAMVKKDYLKLMEILKNDNRFNLYFDDYKHHCCGYVFIDSIWWQASTNGFFPRIYPIKLDIRPLNVIKNEESEIQKNLIYRKVAEFIIFNKYNENDLKTINEILGTFQSKEDFLQFYNTEYGLEDINGNVKLSHPYLSYSYEDVIDKNLIFPLKRVPFENIQTYIPESDKLLVILYGDYMKLPPEEDRVSYSCALYSVKENKVKDISRLYKKRILNALNFFGKIEYRLKMFLYSKLYK